ncbi:EamA family transporter [Candidatus Woesearchaeota archaeon]|nr:EamA family transporter [Candidatus Woesearchaeota archaeon]MBL7050715.1 EamA family transporter [Candidatus Woesearchaeota archaeon]
MKTRLSAIILVIFCTIFTSAGQILWKLGVRNLELSFLGLITNYPLILGFVSYGIGTVLLVVALKYGELSVLYPFIALSFIWVGFMSVAFLGEVMTFLKWIAILLIIGGVSLIGFGGDRHG